MKVSLAPMRRLDHHLHFLGLLGQGLARHGVEIGWCNGTPTGDFVACWGWHQGSLFKQKGYPVLVMERGYLGDRFKWTSVGWNGINGNADFKTEGVAADRKERWADDMLPVRDITDSGEVVIMGQMQADSSVRHINLAVWYQQAADAIRDASYEPKFREHPGVFWSGDLVDELGDCAGVVTFNSTSAVKTVMAGIPTVAMDPGSMVYDLVSRELPFEQPTQRKRSSWLKRMAYCQWTEEELASGEAWEHIGREFDG